MPRFIAYVVVREDLWGPVVRSQVLEVLERLGSPLRQRIILIWFVRMDMLLRRGGEIRSIRESLLGKGLHLVTLPFVAWRFPVTWFLLPLVLPQWLLGLLWLCLRYDCRIFHCRSYHAGLAATVLKKVLRIKVIFDPRSPFPEENLAAGRWGRGRISLNFLFWKKIEKWIARHCDRIIATSRPFAEFFESYTSAEKISVIPNNYVGLPPGGGAYPPNGQVTICYAGSFGHWNNPGTYLRFMSLVAEKDSLLRFKFIISPGTRDFFEHEITAFPLLNDRVEVCSVAQEEVLLELSEGTAGVQIMEQPDARLGIKVVEYLAAGLPVIVSSNVRGAADAISAHGVGLVLDDRYRNVDEVIAFTRQVAADREHWRQRCQKVARGQFSSEAVAGKLSQLYQALA